MTPLQEAQIREMRYHGAINTDGHKVSPNTLKRWRQKLAQAREDIELIKNPPVAQPCEDNLFKEK